MRKSYAVNEHGIYSHFRGVNNLRKNIERNSQRNPKHSVLDLLKKLHELNNMQVFANLDGNLIHNYYWMLVVSRDDLKQTAELIQEAVRERNLFAFAYPDDNDRRDYHNEVASSYFPVQFTKLFKVLKSARIATQSNVMRLRDLVATLAQETRYDPLLALSFLEQLLVFLKENNLLTTDNLQVIIQNRTYAKDEMINGIPGRKVLPMVNLLQSLKSLIVDDAKSSDVKQTIFDIFTRVDRPQDVVPVIEALRSHNVKHATVLKRFLKPVNLAILNVISAYKPEMTDAEQVAFARQVDKLFPNNPEWNSQASVAKNGLYALLKGGFLNPNKYPANILYMLNSLELMACLEAIAILADNKNLTANYCAYVLAANRPVEKAKCFCGYEAVKGSIPVTHKQLFKEIFATACFRLELFVACVALHQKGLLNDEIMTLIFNNWLCILNRNSFKGTLEKCMDLNDSTSLKDCLANPSSNLTGKPWQSSMTLLGTGVREEDSYAINVESIFSSNCN